MAIFVTGLIMMGKICFVCGLTKPIDDFQTPKGKKKGLVCLCQQCDARRKRLLKRVPVLMKIAPHGGLLLKTMETLQLCEVDQRFDQCHHYMACLYSCSIQGGRDGGSWFCSPVCEWYVVPTQRRRITLMNISIPSSIMSENSLSIE